MARHTHVFDENLQKQLLLEFKQRSKIKSQEFSKFVSDKNVLITIIFGQCDEATKSEIALGENYNADRQAWKLIKFFNQLRTICFGSNNRGLS